MARHGFGRGEYKYSRTAAAAARSCSRAVSLAGAGRKRWNLQLAWPAYPDGSDCGFCSAAISGQTGRHRSSFSSAGRLQNCLPQKTSSGEHCFRCRAILLAEPARIFAGGEFVHDELSAKGQRADVVPLRKGDCGGVHRQPTARDGPAGTPRSPCGTASAASVAASATPVGLSSGAAPRASAGGRPHGAAGFRPALRLQEVMPAIETIVATSAVAAHWLSPAASPCLVALTTAAPLAGRPTGAATGYTRVDPDTQPWPPCRVFARLATEREGGELRRLRARCLRCLQSLRAGARGCRCTRQERARTTGAPIVSVSLGMPATFPSRPARTDPTAKAARCCTARGGVGWTDRCATTA
ncbi:hypothetical protein FQR65_LT20406 [Abscondita terminalis]|nr:hypothetical protein FQR65_LT20406 [Abscondita terminalis]